MGIRLSWKILQKNIMPDFRSIDPNRIAQRILLQLNSNFTLNLTQKSKQD